LRLIKLKALIESFHIKTLEKEAAQNHIF